MTDATLERVRPRDRILGTARSLFRQCGIRGAGVDAIAESAGTNKMTLYRHFHSKDDLIVACLREASVDADKGWGEILASHPDDPRAQLDAWVLLIDRYIQDGMCCEVANAAVELPEAAAEVRATIAEFKNQQRERLVRLCFSAGIRRPEALADMLYLLVEGARVSRQAVGVGGPNRSFVECARSAIALFAAEGGSA
ncbi:TetR/AcrR family transcriptional regulator [Aureimonas leprariae]|uniref:TetR/AcrR family transcriptional regulator n=1 Tax=Plantimonas leprariae TaxID=2615207 RepID=A0A7V7PLG2_9HYPH|nr:TetR/AcrR family transcriptional regulator [Aureimonas leprariae]KAB0677171.1 TetR/AcrR family transcriptional regulator [Aureimonas leprariae]